MAEPKCEAYGVAYDEEDDECQKCDVKVKCNTLTNGDGETEEVQPMAKKKDDVSSLVERVENLELRVAELVEAGEGGEATAAAAAEETTTSKTGKKKTSTAEKDKIKKKLAKGIPYKKDKLEGMKASEVKMLCSAMDINSFGLSKDKAIAAIMKEQKKKKWQK